MAKKKQPEKKEEMFTAEDARNVFVFDHPHFMRGSRKVFMDVTRIPKTSGFGARKIR